MADGLDNSIWYLSEFAILNFTTDLSKGAGAHLAKGRVSLGMNLMTSPDETAGILGQVSSFLESIMAIRTCSRKHTPRVIKILISAAALQYCCYAYSA